MHNYPASYYAATTNLLELQAPAQGTIETDICIMGGGYTGLSTALELAERGYRVCVLEQHRIGWGASGRNGGQICSGYSCDMEDIIEDVGLEAAKTLWQYSEDSKHLLLDRCARYNIEAEYQPGYLFSAVKAKHIGELQAMQELWYTAFGYEQFELLQTQEALSAHISSPRYCGGLLDHGGGHLHPLKYALGLARAVQQAGGILYEHSPVVSYHIQGNKVVVQTDQATITANFLVLAGNAYAKNIAPHLEKTVMPVGTYIIATEPLSEAVSQRLLPSNAAVADCNFILDYFRLSADRRLLFGGGVNYRGTLPNNIEKALRPAMARVFPDLKNSAIEYRWGGYVGISQERTPHVGRLEPQVYFAQAFSGHGLALTGMVGKSIALAIDGQARAFDAFAKLSHKPFPGGKMLRTPLLATAMLYYRLLDLL